MVTYKLALDGRRAKQDGTYPLVIRVTYNRQVTNFQTGIFLKSEQWDKATLQVTKNNPNWSALSLKATEEYVKIQKVILSIENEQPFSFDLLKDRLNKRVEVQHTKHSMYFEEFAQTLVRNLFAIKKTGNAIVYRTAINRLKSYTNNPKLRFIDIDYDLLDGFKSQLIKDKVKQNTISNYFRTLRAIYNKAIKAKLISRTHYPFLDIAIKAERTPKRAITIDDLIKIARVNLKPDSQEWKARNYFLLSFTLIGISFTDLAYLKPENVKAGRLIYKRRKTGKELSLKILPCIERSLTIFTGSNPAYLLPIVSSNIIENSLDAKKQISQWIKTTNKYLDKMAKTLKIDKEITTYVARHTWATTAKRMGYSNEMIAEAMGHEYGNKITNIYLDNFDQNLIDEMNEKVVSIII